DDVAPEPAFEGPDPPAERRLRDVRIRCRARKAAGLSQAEEVLQPLDVHLGSCRFLPPANGPRRSSRVRRWDRSPQYRATTRQAQEAARCRREADDGCRPRAWLHMPA